MAKMIYCKECGKEISSKAKTCPGCGAKNKKPFYKNIGFYIIIFIVLIIIAGNNSKSSDNGSGNYTVSKSQNLELVDAYQSSESNEYFYYIEGHIKNNTTRDYTYVSVTFITYDKNGNTIGTCLDNNSGLNASGTWKFKAICTDGINEIDHYELKEVTGY